MKFETKDLKPRIATLVYTDLATLLDGEMASRIRSLLEQRGVLVFRGVALDDETQLAFTRTFGDVYGLGSGDIYKVSLDKKVNPTHADYNYGNFSWHIDRTDTDIPPFASILAAKALASTGGETEFANTYAAYDDLSDDMKTKIEGLEVVHKLESSYRETIPEPTDEQLSRWRAHSDKVHPLVWRHRSGRKSLITSMSGTEVVGWSPQDGAALLKAMLEWASRDEYVYVHEWQLGDVVMWDNTGVMHKARPYPLDCGRLMHRTTVAGNEPFDLGKSPALA